MIRRIQMVVFICSACINEESPPQFGDWLPQEWEEEEVNGKLVHYCPFHKYGLSEEEIRRVRAATS